MRIIEGLEMNLQDGIICDQYVGRFSGSVAYMRVNNTLLFNYILNSNLNYLTIYLFLFNCR